MAADSSPSRSHTCLRPPQCPLRTLQFIGPPFSFLSLRTKSSSNRPKVKAPSSPGTADPTRATRHSHMGSSDYPKTPTSDARSLSCPARGSSHYAYLLLDP